MMVGFFQSFRAISEHPSRGAGLEIYSGLHSDLIGISLIQNSFFSTAFWTLEAVTSAVGRHDGPQGYRTKMEGVIRSLSSKFTRAKGQQTNRPT